MSTPANKYKKRKKWSQEDMAAAVQAVREKRMGYLKAANTYNVPRTTVFRLAKQTELPMEDILTKKIGRKPVFNKAFEDTLVTYALLMEDKLYGLTQMDMRRIAYQLAVRNNVSNPFKDERAGRYWLKGFLSRHKHILSMRKPSGTSFARANGFTKERMDEFYDILEKVYDEKKFPASRIFNVDETGISIVQSKYPKIISRRGKKQIGAMSSAERGSLITIVTCMSPAGIFVPPMMIFPRKNMSENLMKGAPVGSIGRAHPSGWIQTYLFTQWFQHFIDYVKPSEASPVLLLFDGHFSHTKNIELVDKARENHVTLISLPPHCTHKIQPMDKSFMSPLKTYYSEEIRMWLRQNNRPLTAYDIAELFGKAYRKCQTGEIAAKGFSVGGIYPFNRYIFTESDFAAAAHDVEEELIPENLMQGRPCITELPGRSKPTSEPRSPNSDSTQVGLDTPSVIHPELPSDISTFSRVSVLLEQDQPNLDNRQVRLVTPNLSSALMCPKRLSDISITKVIALLEQAQSNVDGPSGQSAQISELRRHDINCPQVGNRTPNSSSSIFQLLGFGEEKVKTVIEKRSVSKKTQIEINRDQKTCPSPSCSGPIVTPFHISPMPLAKKRMSNRGRKTGKSEIISSSPYKQELEEAEKKKNKKIQKVAKNEEKDQSKENNKRKGKGTGKGKGKVGSEQEGKRRSGNNVEKKDKSKAKTQSAAKRKILQEENTNSDSDATFTSDKSEEELTYESVKQPTGDDCVCFFCNGKYAEDRRGEEWVQCFMCEGWVHSECGGYDTGCYVCDYCKN